MLFLFEVVVVFEEVVVYGVNFVIFERLGKGYFFVVSVVSMWWRYICLFRFINVGYYDRYEWCEFLCFDIG